MDRKKPGPRRLSVLPWHIVPAIVQDKGKYMDLPLVPEQNRTTDSLSSSSAPSLCPYLSMQNGPLQVATNIDLPASLTL